MINSLFFFSLVVLLVLSLLSPSFILCQSSSLSSSPCYSPSATSIPLYSPPSSNNNNDNNDNNNNNNNNNPPAIFCPAGFYCPHLDPLDNRTWPIYCSPSVDCAEKRGRGEYCDLQGYYEITVCPKGFYCPEINIIDYINNYNTSRLMMINNNNNNNNNNDNNGVYQKFLCPEDYYCPLGCISPKKCTSLADCPEGSERQTDYTPLLILLLMDITVFLLIIRWEKHNKNNRLIRKKLLVDTGKINEYSSDESNDLDNNNNNNNTNNNNNNNSNNSNTNHPNGAISLSVPSSSLSSLASIFLKSQMAAGQSNGLNIRFTDYSLRLPASGQQKEKILLQGVTGEVKSGSVTAIMGPSGCGKTTFLSTLMGKIDSSWPRSGSVVINNSPTLTLSQFQQYIGYSPQDDVIRRDLTVYENLYYSASIRLPPPPILSEEERLNHINNVMEIMGLMEYRDQLIGTDGEEGDGGQALSLEVRKRINIALELCAAPLSIFLDEPTTGLDSYWALQLTSLLKSLARISQISVVMIIHQPRAEIWKSLDNLLLLAPGGRTVYQGPQRYVVPYFSSHPALSIRFEMHQNAADVLMDKIAEMGMKMASSWAEGGKEYLDKIIKGEEEGGENNNNNNYINNNNNDNNNNDNNELKEEKVSADLQKNHLTVTNNNNGNNNNTPLSASTISKETVKAIDRQMAAEAERREIEGKQQWKIDEEKNNAIRNALLETLSINNNNSNNNNNDSNNNTNNNSLPRRGASLFYQIYLCTVRAFLQQLYSTPTLLWECSVGLILGIIFGAGMDKDYAGVLKGMFVLLSPTGQEFAPLQTGMFLSWLTGLPAAVPAIGLFGGGEQTMYWRESASGHSRVAYFIGVNLSALPRIVMGSFHAATFFFITAAPQYSFAEFYPVMLMAYFATYGVASFLVMLINRNNATLVTVVLSIITGILNGYVAIIPNVIQWLCYSRWLSEGIFTLMAQPFIHIMQVEEQSVGTWDYTYDVYARNLWILLGLGIGYRLLGYLFMVNRYKEKQR